ncbi:MAG: hypothetical protein FWC10_02170 [Lentimicrobiaceae bacterium]|nr:hypothetical protein [Lentimicrobiaceae bacterium]
MKFLRLFKKNLSLRIVNIVGLAIMFTCLLLSASYIKRELNYDKHNTNADRIVRISLQFDNEPVDVRIWGNIIDPFLNEMPEIEQVAKMHNIRSATLAYKEKKEIIKDFYAINSQFLDVFDLTFLHGTKEDVLQQKVQALISETLARELFGEIDNGNFQKSVISIDGARWKDSIVNTIIFKDFPETSHFNSDIFLFLPDDFRHFTYDYLLLKKDTDIKVLEQKINDLLTEYWQGDKSARAFLMPLTDIHLYSHNLREMSINGNINYIYLIIGANVLLLVVVFFNLWLNASLVFGRNKRYYQLLRLHGTSPAVVFKDETLSALLVGIISISLAIFVAIDIDSLDYFFMQLSIFEIFILCAIFLSTIVLVSLFPVLQKISLTQFLNTRQDLKPVKFSYANIKYMLVAQYAVVMIVVILAVGIAKQVKMMENTQVGGNEQNILALSEQPDLVLKKYSILKSELLKHKEIESVTAAMQLPGDAIIDGTNVKREEDVDWKHLNIMAVGEEFLPFFNIPLIAGNYFSARKYDYQTEFNTFMEFLTQGKYSDHVEKYVINRKALNILGFNSPEEAIGQVLVLEHGTIAYFNKGIIVGVTDDFNYTGLFEETNPLLIMQRNLFLFNVMVRLNSENLSQARTVFDSVWKEVIPEYPADYMFMSDLFGKTYRNEMNAKHLVLIFSVLCFAVADLGLIVFMAYIIRRRTREIGLRKVHGASISEVLQMLNTDFIKYIAMAFVIAIPVAWYLMHRWLEQFAYRTSLSWWIFALAGLSVLFISVLSVSLQSWRAATSNPIDAIKVQ